MAGQGVTVSQDSHAETLAWLGIDVWQQRVPARAMAERVPAAEPDDVQAELAAPDADDAVVVIRAPVDGPLRRLAERIARLAALAPEMIETSAATEGVVLVDGRSWSLDRLVAEPAAKRELWQCLSRR